MASALERWKLKKQQQQQPAVDAPPQVVDVPQQHESENASEQPCASPTARRTPLRRASAMNAQRRLSLQLQPTSQQKSRRSSLAATATPTTTGKRSRRGSMVADEIIVEQEVVEEQVEQVVQDESVAVVVDQQPEQQVLTTAVPEEVLPVQAVVLQQDAPVEQEVKRRRAWDVRDSPEDQAAKLQSIRAAFMSNAASAVPCTPLVANNSLRRSVQAMPRPSPLRTVAVPMAVSPTPTPNDNREFAVLQARYTALEAELAATVRARDAAEAEAARLRQTVTELRQQLQQHQQPALQIQQIQPPVRTNSNNGVTTSASTASTATNSGAVRVYCRVRPPLPNEVELSADHRLVVSAQKITVVRREKSLQSTQMLEKARDFDLNCFGATSTQDEVFDAVKPLVRTAMEGKSACVFAYGQTASGKTFTMLGTEQALGVIPRAINLAFDHAERSSGRGGTVYEFRVAYCELYCDQVYDLLSASRAPLALRQAGNNGPVTVVGLSWLGVSSRAQLYQLIGAANQARATATTNKNDNSSRSHTVLQLEVTVRSVADVQARKTGVLSLIDLAGSERVSASGVVGAQLKETQAINASLAVLGDVVSAIAAGRTHVPFRESKLTRMLEPHLVANDAKTIVLVTLSPHLADATETLSSLQFAAKAANCATTTLK